MSERIHSNEDRNFFSPEEIRKGATESGENFSKGKETTGQLKFELEEIEQKMALIRRNRDKERRVIVDDINIELKEKSVKLKSFDIETEESLKPLKENRDKIERYLKSGGHA